MSDPQKPDNPPPLPPTGEQKDGAATKKGRFGFLYVLILLLVLIALVQVSNAGYYRASYDEFLFHVRNGHVEWVQLGEKEHVGQMNVPKGAPQPPSARFHKKAETANSRGAARQENSPETSEGVAGGEKTLRVDQKPPFGGRLPDDGEFLFRVNPVRSQEEREKLIALLTEQGVLIENKPPEGFWTTLLIYSIPILLIFGVWYMMMRQSGQMGRTALTFGRSRAKLYAETVKTVTFGDVAGCDEAKEELQEVVDYLRSPKKYQTLGGKMPKGILLVGPPGTGKTLLARAVAGESQTPFFSLSGSDFVEMFVGVGAARVRDLFQQAKRSAPCIVFVDELDAVGRHRGAGLGGGHDEREQTLNQLLVEMDGFDSTQSVIFLAATNRPDVLDPALLRPGRFDRQVVIDAPDAKGRRAVLEVHAHGKEISEEVDFNVLASSTPGFTGADLANVLNEAALLAARAGKKKIGQRELEEAVERSIAGPERKSRRLNDEVRKRVAYHEAGHALVAALSKHADPVRKISIIPRGHAALGYTMQSPDDDRYLTTRDMLLDRLKGLLAGRAAELLVFNELSTGAHNDLERASQIARSMVCQFGMSEKLGPVTFGRSSQQVFLGRDFNQEERNFSEKSAQEIDSEVRRILDETNDAATVLLRDHVGCLEHIAETLLQREVIQGEELDQMLKSKLCNGGPESPDARAIEKVTADQPEKDT